MAETETWTIGRLLLWTAKYLTDRGAASPRLDAEVLLAEARNCQRIALYTAYEEVPDETVRTAFRELVRRRAEGTPVAYLVGRREFFSLSFRVNSDVLIPRPETEFVVTALLDRIKQSVPPVAQPAIADVGTGSGILAVCAARHVPGARVTAVDISPQALAVAQANAAQHGVSDRINFQTGDLLAGLPAEAMFDFIVSNPPYISSAEFAGLSPEVKDQEPRQALEAGPRGTEVIERLLPQAAERLRPGGWLFMEVSPMIDSSVRAMIAADNRWLPVPTIKDLAGQPRVVQAQRQA
ncbi:MAG: peptide chain release factor N(5)-glutamine methyltransferase [Pirellulales bacterium]